MDYRQQLIEQVKSFPSIFEKLIEKIYVHNLNTKLNGGEWTIAQNVHHVADAHINKCFQIKQCLTENTPNLREFNDAGWVKLADGKDSNIQCSINIIKGIHSRVATLLQSLDTSSWSLSGMRNGSQETVLSIAESLVKHGNAHIEQIEDTLKKIS